ncbi:tRNA (adenosine(37)-N6)-threonylcarbamoyltransferase complex dimerization subunit type 1 TsaB [Frigidibacter sp. RF13]|uniref:tRNA (adenosine(37)-N6)-threonylcarbamoyltransferase complex dimerization subunit type 1 TsaB n=1 Tax=Frigidibacter sp. RF13 TaxID=2997340 RepID=UPI002270FAE0|nr:tRNA (adenosine(37)-N6)-threonylcarbamoyltransferase complex dimerization subunit type 1 TsaB [Frigidibacter sp. RF13]MCY1126188.1 tRNA (adenosine(37)-N6)-threonylcarbamoyltransferase complex dimerization subunit type 1 TsaB [Frigidibacter sp. RF13]
MPPEALILAFDTSAAHCAAALVLGDKILSERTEPMATGQAERLFPMLEEMLDGAGCRWADLTAIGVGIGPGNFTGVRLSVSAARGLSLSLGVPTVGVSSLEALVHGVDEPCIASLDARQGRLYVQLFCPAHVAAPVLCDLDTLPDMPAAIRPVCIGYQAEEIAARVGGRPQAHGHNLPVAIARLAAARYMVTVSAPAPLYLRPADAAPSRQAPPVMLP